MLRASLVLLVGCATAFTPMRPGDWVAQGALLGEALIDAGQTVYITRDHGEVNPFVGDHGQINPPPSVGALTLWLEFCVAWALPRSARTAWEGFVLGAEGLNVYSNAMEGYWPWGKR